jgi:drug/metabolite transporter (DMT)-like permease
MLAALLALLASFSWGSSNYLAGIESRRRSVWHVTALSQIAAAAVAGVALLAARQAPPGLVDAAVLVLAGVATAIGLLAFYRALAIGTMSIVAPIIALEVLLPVAGVVLISWARRGKRDHIARRAILLAVLAAVCWGVMLVALGVSGRRSPYWAVFDIRSASAVVIALYVVATGRRLPLKGQNLPVLFLVGLLLTVANILFTVAAGIGLLSIVSILGSLSPVVVTGYAQILLGERLSARQWVGFVTVFAGIVLLSV